MVRVQGATTDHQSLWMFPRSYISRTRCTHACTSGEGWQVCVFGELIKDSPASLYLSSSSSFTICSHHLACWFFPELVTFSSGMHLCQIEAHQSTHTHIHALKPTHTYTHLPLGEWVHSSGKLTHTVSVIKATTAFHPQWHYQDLTCRGC